MKRLHLALLTAIFAFLLNPAFTNAQATMQQPSVKVKGEVITPIELKLSDLKQLEQTKVTRKDRDGKDHTYTGVLLATILQKAGVTMGKELKGENLTKYITVEASDGYQVIFALAELDKDFTDRQIILASEIDGQPLPMGDGGFRIIVQDEKKPARCIKMVTSITVKFAK
ncbi:MAG: molybdopterin-dependent oxidoreductase [Mucilaginibacter sp.]|uniref:molybdopterin-dependent oxidoreductase n=1 Tax=Mucilaginibacter sp. TaxID=1882438 RepID=UPI003262FB14